MATVATLIDQLRDMTGETADETVPFATKVRYLNQGINAMWPAIFRLVQTTITVVADQYDYTVPVGAADGFITSVEITTEADGTEFRRFDQYDIIDGDEDLTGTFRLGVSATQYEDFDIRITYAAPVAEISPADYAAAAATTWVGPDRARKLPVLYAMALITGAKLNPRQDNDTYNVTTAQNGVDDNDLMSGMNLWMAQFEVELERASRPLPIAKD